MPRSLVLLTLGVLGPSVASASSPGMFNTAEILRPGTTSVVFENRLRAAPDYGYSPYLGIGVGVSRDVDACFRLGYDIARGHPYIGVDGEFALSPDSWTPAMSLTLGVHASYGFGFDLGWMISREYGSQTRTTLYAGIDGDLEFSTWNWWKRPGQGPFPRVSMGGESRRGPGGVIDLADSDFWLFPGAALIGGLAIRPRGPVELLLEGSFHVPRMEWALSVGITVYQNRRR